MAGKQAKILSSDAFNLLLAYASSSRYPLRNTVIVLLSVKAGLRAGEIAKLSWPMILDPNGKVGRTIALHDKAAKKGSGRSIPIHQQLAEALEAWADTQAELEGFVIRSERGGPMSPLSVVVWFRIAFDRTGLKGCSSHSGRRTFITRAARLVHKAGGSLRDVQLLAGHASIQTTQRYIDGDSDAQRLLVTLI